MRTYCLDNSYRAAFADNTLFIFDDVRDETILRMTNVIPSSEELAERNFHSLDEYYNVEIRRIIEDELHPLELDLAGVKTLISYGYGDCN